MSRHAPTSDGVGMEDRSGIPPPGSEADFPARLRRYAEENVWERHLFSFNLCYHRINIKEIKVLSYAQIFRNLVKRDFRLQGCSEMFRESGSLNISEHP